MGDILRMSGIKPLRQARIADALDKDDSTTIAWTEFIAAALCVSVSRGERRLGAAFATIDSDRDGRISQKDIQDTFGKADAAATWVEHLPAQCEHISPGGGPYSKDQFM